MTEPQPQKPDLAVRTLSGIGMVAVAGCALWLGGWVWTIFVAAIAVGVMWEWAGLVSKFGTSPVKRGLWILGGIGYIGIGAFALAEMRTYAPVGLLVGMVIATDVGAYFAGRAVGGPKIAPSISPSKTWAGLVGGMLGAIFVAHVYVAHMMLILVQGYECKPCVVESLFQYFAWIFSGPPSLRVVLVGSGLAILAQAGDFFESWMKRRARVKDSGALLPGHGGLFDRLDGLLAVAFVLGVLNQIKDL